MILAQAIVQLLADNTPPAPDLGQAWPWVTGIVTPTAVAGIFYKAWHDAKAEVAALQKTMMDEVIPLLTRNVDVLKSLDAKLAPSTVKFRDDAP